MPSLFAALRDHEMDNFKNDGWELICSPYSVTQLEALRAAASRLADQMNPAVRETGGAVYAARNVLDLAPDLIHLWRAPILMDRIREILGERTGLVRALYFDKPPEQTWALPWHKDLLIAVADEAVVPKSYSRPRLRAGVLHTEPPVEVLNSMLTLRIHLDAMTAENGPLKVLSRSHTTGKTLQTNGFAERTIQCEAGDALLMYEPNSIYRRQDLPPVYMLDGGIIAVTRKSLFEPSDDGPHGFLGADRRAVVNAPGAVVDIDSAVDLRVAEAVLLENLKSSVA